MKLSLVSSALLLAAACSSSTKPAAKGRKNMSGGASGVTVRSIDWRNRTYDSSDIGPITVKDGVYEYALDGEGNVVAPDYKPTNRDEYVAHGSFKVTEPVFGDLDGDGTEEAVLVTCLNGGGTGRFSHIGVYAIRDGKETVIGGIPGGDRGDGGIDDVKLQGKVLIVSRMMSMADDGACCPSKLQHERWSWNGTSFVEDEAARTMSDFGNK